MCCVFRVLQVGLIKRQKFAFCWRMLTAWLPTLAAARYGPARGCDEALNAWCEANCPHAQSHSPLFARLDTNQHSGPLTWRCYAKSTLTDDLMEGWLWVVAWFRLHLRRLRGIV